MKRALTLIALAFGLVVQASGPASAQVPGLCTSPTPLGFVVPQAPGWWNCNFGTATALVTPHPGPDLPGYGTRALQMRPRNNQTIVSTTLVVVPGVTRVVQLEDLVYHTFVRATDANYQSAQAPTIQLSVDVDGDRLWDTNLVFDPFYNGGVVPGIWQQWDARGGLWYSTRPVLGMTPQATLLTLDEINARARSQDGGNGPYVVFSLLASDPGADIRIQFGSSGGEFDGLGAWVDGVRIKAFRLPGTNTDFEDPITYVAKLLT